MLSSRPTLIFSAIRDECHTAGIGNGNNNFDGNANSGIDNNTTQGGKVDESFVVDPELDVSSVKVFIDNSVGGYVFGELGRLPKRGDVITADGYEIRVEAVRENRIEAVRVRKRDD